MEIRLLDKKTEVEAVNKFMPFPVVAEDLPGHTYCVVARDEIVAIAGLRMMEGDMCYLDSMASNQNFESTIRHEALDCLIKKLLDTAKELNFRRVFGATREDCVLSRVERHGFSLSKQKIVTKEIS